MNENIQQKIEELEENLAQYNSGIAIGIHPFEIADLLMEINTVDESTYETLLKRLPSELLAEILVELPKSLQEHFYDEHGAKGTFQKQLYQKANIISVQ